MIKYTFIIPYFRRAVQFYNTLASMRYYYGKRDDWNIIVVEDSKNDDELRSVVKLFEDDIRIDMITTGRKDLYNPSPAYNAGVAAAIGEYVVLTSPECMHMGDVLMFFDTLFKSLPNVYAVVACESGKNIKGVYTKPGSVTYDRHMWYQHTVHRHAGYHFCSALKREMYIAMGGFDERYADGYCFDDDSFRDRVGRAGIKHMATNDVFVLHQEHEKPSVPKALWERNRKLYEDEVARCRPELLKQK